MTTRRSFIQYLAAGLAAVCAGKVGTDTFRDKTAGTVVHREHTPILWYVTEIYDQPLPSMTLEVQRLHERSIKYDSQWWLKMHSDAETSYQFYSGQR